MKLFYVAEVSVVHELELCNREQDKRRVRILRY
jgi:hypothetical protein